MTYLKNFGWGRVTALAVVLLAACAYWIASEARIPSGSATIILWQWAAVFASLLVVSLIAGCMAQQRFIGVLIDERNRISLSRVQWLAWFLVLFSSYFTGAVWDVAGFGGDVPKIEPNLFGLIGITTGSGVISNVLVEAKKQQQPTAAAVQGFDPHRGKIDINASPAQAAWQDLYLGEETANRQTVDASRLQKLIVTILLVIVYIEMVASALSEASQTYHAFDLPVVGSNFLVLMGASHAAYLAYKATNKP
jgi:hypothetical protein